MKVSMTHDRGTHNLKIEGDGIAIIHVISFISFSGTPLYRVNFTVTDRYGRVYIIDRELHPSNLNHRFASDIVVEMGHKSLNAFDSPCSDIAVSFFKHINHHFAI